jgi:Family of unknown function (DUF6152)
MTDTIRRRSALGGRMLAPVVLAAPMLTALSTAAFAHHSFSMFDPKSEQILVGTVTAFQWTNPHTWIELDAPSADGKLTHWSIEGGSVVGLAREGWTRRTLQPGDKISLVMHPLRSGQHGGSLMGVVTAQGKVLGAPLHPPEKKDSAEAR